MIKFSIITVCLNAGNDLIDTVVSTLNQTYTNFEIIVKDGLSTDGSVERLPVDPRIRLIRQKDTGIYDAMNQGIDEATGDYFIFINAGDELHNEHVLSEIDEHIRKSDADIYYGHNYNLRFCASDIVPPRIDKRFCFRSMICHQSTIYKAELLKRRPYDPSYKISADRERMVYAVVRERAVCQYIPIIISTFKSGGVSSEKIGQICVQEEDGRIKREYFTAWERFNLTALHHLTFPRIRRRIAMNVKWSKYYRMIVDKLYKTGIGK